MPRPCRALPLRLLPLLLALLPLATFAAPPEELLEEQVRALLTELAAGPGREVEVQVHPAAAQLPPCEDPQPFLPQVAPRLPGRVTVGVQCSTAGTRYLQATVSIHAEYPVARRALAAGEVLEADMLELQRGDLGRLPRHAVLDPRQALGRELTRPLQAGQPLPANALRNVPLVERGARVRVEARASGFVVSRDGIALDSGASGEQVRVRSAGGEILRARVTGRNLLSVEF